MELNSPRVSTVAASSVLKLIFVQKQRCAVLCTVAVADQSKANFQQAPTSEKAPTYEKAPTCEEFMNKFV